MIDWMAIIGLGIVSTIIYHTAYHRAKELLGPLAFMWPILIPATILYSVFKNYYTARNK